MKAIEWINRKYDINEEHDAKIELEFELDKTKKLTVIAGGSGTGKTTLLRNWFNIEDVTFNISDDKSIFEHLVKEDTDEEFTRVSKLLFDVGLASVPVWKSPYSKISNGEKLRFEIAYKLNSDEDIIFIDEFTSMLDRQTAKNLCNNLNNLQEQYDKQIVLATAHFDILDWLKVDQVVDTNVKKHLVLPEQEVLTLTKWRLDVLNNSGGTYLATITI